MFFCYLAYSSSIKVFIELSFMPLKSIPFPRAATFLLKSSHRISTNFCFCFSLLLTKSHKILKSYNWNLILRIF